MASNPRKCTSCRVHREPVQFLSKTNRILKTCSICRERAARFNMKKKAANAQLDYIQHAQNRYIEPSTPVRPHPIFLYRGPNSQNFPMHMEARNPQNLDQRAHCIARQGGEDIAPTQPFEGYLRHKNSIDLNQENIPTPQTSQIGPDSTPVSSQNPTSLKRGLPRLGRPPRLGRSMRPHLRVLYPKAPHPPTPGCGEVPSA